jgi:hypothetical protein
MRRLLPTLALLLGGALALAGAEPRPAAAQATSIESFFGEYVGEAITQAGEDLDKRSINARIRPLGPGFETTWTLVIEKPGGRIERSENTFRFLPTRRPNVFSSAMRTDMFGNAVPLDPMKGDPYLWARLQNQTLSIYALLITEEGGYEVQVYERSLRPGGLDLRFTRLRDGVVKRTITGTLKKVR